MLCYDIDDETLHLVLQMHMEDLEELKQNSKGKHREDELPDADFAIDMYRSEIESRALFASDRSMCKSIAQANRRDGQLVSAIVEEEQQAANDRAFAVWLSREDPFFQENEDVTPSPPPRQPPPAPPPGPPPAAGGQYNPSSNDAFLRKLQIMYMDTGAGDEDEDVNMLNQPESSSWGGSRPRSKSRSHAVSRGKRRCNSCLNDLDFTDVARCPCNHEYCRDCLRTLFETAITDEALFPPRCCGQHIPVEENRVFLSPELIGRFRARELELSTQDKTYCHGPTCSQFIPKEFIKDSIATCQRCRRRTCTTCKGVEHRNEDCPEDESTQSVLQVADENQWQQCRQCNRLVELAHGCYHITPDGRHALARSGKRTDSLLAPTPSSTETPTPRT
ncbi:ibr finger domain protein [Colletotrichum karsti]|uniref:RBR-type E3 ubiquitin transferase n=1 Tax=Colletotrichum karsti TaxID=1095194 RepID=A0A9P6IDQ0_9PEZI|nr:ibr finger domain protein [Colletotrichum karsti]KAF9881663.1 ibr finger domain protein [Colletotrichum karsti]